MTATVTNYADAPLAPSRRTTAMTLTEHQRMLIRESFQDVAKLGDAAGAAFYDRLFEVAPEVRPMFPATMASQSAKLTMALKAVVDNISDWPALTGVLETLARRHVEYGVRPEHYPVVGRVLLETLAAALGERFTNETRYAWAAAYGSISDTMIRAAYPQAA